MLSLRKITLSLYALLWVATVSAIEVTRTTCELITNPVGITTKVPRLGWQLHSSINNDKQTAYQIILSMDNKSIERGVGRIWNSGVVKSDKSQFVEYAGPELKEGQRYLWRVKVWDANKKASAWSEVSSFETAPPMATAALWISAISRKKARLPEGRNFHQPSMKKKEIADLWGPVDSLAKRSILLRHPIAITKKVKSAQVIISGLGQYELTLNGEKIGQSQFAPAWSDYDKTVYYNIYDVKKSLTQGENIIGVMLGNGMYNVTGDRYRKFWVSFGTPKLYFIMRLKYDDGTTEQIVSDKSWKYALSPVTFNCIFGGEDYDANLEQPGWDKAGFDDSAWMKVVHVENPKGELAPQLTAPVKIMQTFGVKEVKKIGTGPVILDMGQNLSGFPTIKVQGKKGQTLRLWVGESIKDSAVNQKRTGKPYYFQYTLKGNGVEEWTPRFSYYGYQYIQLDGADYLKNAPGSDKPVLLDVKSNFVYNSTAETGTFECSNDIYNKTHWLINNAIKSNFQSIFTDCPHREKLGWLEQNHLNGPGLMFNYDQTQMFAKVIRDMQDAQLLDGLVPTTAPEYTDFESIRDFKDSPEWGATSAILPWMYYEYYGDASQIEKAYPMMTRYMAYLDSKAKGDTLAFGLGDWYDYGPKPAGYSQNSPIALSATAFYYYYADLVAKSAKMLGFKKEAKQYEKRARAIRRAFNAKFFNPKTKQYGTGSQYSNAMPIFLNIVEPKYRQAVLDNLVADIKAHGDR
ncbi:MAG: family 78 glycoside hydrolase catalytic domain, partial [Bacteroidota bacterium]|nr:family 78 glycoside hydrolase catalytic domain [Bacteroidota bacterium]